MIGIKKIEVTPLEYNEGKIIDSASSTDDKQTNTYSMRIVDNLLDDKVDESDVYKKDDLVPSDNSNNTRLGTDALINYDITQSGDGRNNTAIGKNALKTNTTGYGNTAVGVSTLYDNTTGINNAAVGVGALHNNTTGYGNTALGHDALYRNTTGSDNTAIGYYSARYNTIGEYNTSLGNHSLQSNTEGQYNTSLGTYSLFENTTGSYNTAIGHNAGRNATSYTNTSCLGKDSEVTGSNQVQLGDSSTSLYAYSNVNIRSDKRDKKDIEDTDLGLEFINKLRPVKYKWKFRNNGYEGNRYHQGLIAQEVKKVMDELKIDFGGYQDHKVNGGADVLTLGYGELIPPLIKAIQEQQKMIEDLNKKVEKLSSKK